MRVDDTVREPETAELLGGRYELRELLGTGGMGRVYRARDVTLGRDVALKMIDAARITEPAMRERFLREAHAAARLDHPNIVAVYDADADAGWLAMELVTGTSLGDLLDHGPLTAARVHAIGDQVLSALAAAHAAGVIHRDLKPNNILLGADDKVTLLDFGVARLVDQTMTGTGELLGTPAYMAPEQLRGSRVDARTDLYSLGATLYELVRGERIGSFSTPSADELAAMTAACGDDVGLARVIERCLQEDPNARFASAGEARAGLAKRTLTRPLEIPRPGGVRPVFWLGLVLVLAGSLWLTLRRARRDDDERAAAAPPSQNWFEQNRASCNPVEYTLVIEQAGDYRAACYALAGKIELARADILTLPSPEQQRDAVNLLFDVAHPVADAGDDAAAGPIMELVCDFMPSHYMALYHAGMSRAIADDAVLARNYLTRFLGVYRENDQWARTAKRALDALDRPREQRTVAKGVEGNTVY